MNVIKFTLGSGKVIYLREPTIGDTEKAAQIAGKKAGIDNQLYCGVLVQKEMVKLLLVAIDEKSLSIIDKEQLETFLTYKEYNQTLQAIKMVLGDDDQNLQLTPEFATFGGK
jgi:hypothetical protein